MLDSEIHHFYFEVSAQIQDEQIRVQAAKIDDLQEVQNLVKNSDFDFPTQFVNYK